MDAAKREYNRRYYESHSKELKEYSRNYRKTRSEAVRASEKAYRDANKEKRKEACRQWHLKNKYGITAEELSRMESAQGGKCAICKSIPGKKALCIDHDHVTGQIRQLLCGKCNTMIGLAKDEEEILMEAIKYLRTHKSLSLRKAV